MKEIKIVLRSELVYFEERKKWQEENRIQKSTSTHTQSYGTRIHEYEIQKAIKIYVLSSNNSIKYSLLPNMECCQNLHNNKNSIYPEGSEVDI